MLLIWERLVLQYEFINTTKLHKELIIVAVTVHNIIIILVLCFIVLKGRRKRTAATPHHAHDPPPTVSWRGSVWGRERERERERERGRREEEGRRVSEWMAINLHRLNPVKPLPTICSLNHPSLTWALNYSTLHRARPHLLPLPPIPHTLPHPHSMKVKDIM